MWVKELRHRINEGLLYFGCFAVVNIGEVALVASADGLTCFVESRSDEIGIIQ